MKAQSLRKSLIEAVESWEDRTTPWAPHRVVEKVGTKWVYLNCPYEGKITHELELFDAEIGQWEAYEGSPDRAAGL